MKCKCGNEARYVTARQVLDPATGVNVTRGELSCAICPIRDGEDSVRITDVPLLVAWLRWFIADGPRPLPGDSSAVRGALYQPGNLHRPSKKEGT